MEKLELESINDYIFPKQAQFQKGDNYIHAEN
jgi:hypothetical protein